MKVLVLCLLLVARLPDIHVAASSGNAGSIYELFGDERLGFASLSEKDGEEEKSTQQIFEEFFAWSEKMGILNLSDPAAAVLWPVRDDVPGKPKCFLGEFPSRECFGVVSARSFPAGHTLFKVPRHAVMISDDGLGPTERFPDGQAPYDMGGGGSTIGAYPLNGATAAWLLRERAKGSSSTWAPYIRSLPEYVPLPTGFSTELVSMFELGPTIQKIFVKRSSMQQEYFKSSPSAMANASLSEYLWAMSMVSSRAFSAPMCAEETENTTSSGEGALQDAPAASDAAASDPPAASDATALDAAARKLQEEGEVGDAVCTMHVYGSMLVPVGDLLNHGTNFHHADYVASGDQFVFKARAATSLGKPILDSYGHRSTEDLMLHYGFVPDSNYADKFPLFDTFPELAEFFVEFALPGRTMSPQDVDDVAKAAQEVQKLMPGKQALCGVQFDTVAKGREYIVSAHGQPMPQLVSALATVWLWAHGQLTEHHFDTVAEGAIKLSMWAPTDITCKSFSTLVTSRTRISSEESKRAVVVAFAALYGRLQEHLTYFSTSLDEDVAELKRLRSCKGLDTGDDPSSTGSAGQGEAIVNPEAACSDKELAEFMERDLILQFRIMRKRTLQQAIKFADVMCGMEYDSIREGIPTKDEL